MDLEAMPHHVREKIAHFVERKGRPGLFLTGCVGSGKTHLACALGNHLLAQGIPAMFISAPQLLNDIRKTFDTKGGRTEGQIIEDCQSAGCLILDDLGGEKPSEFAIEKLFLIVDFRYKHMKDLIVTSNLSLDDLNSRANDRLASRIAGMCEIIQMPNRDLRLEGK